MDKKEPKEKAKEIIEDFMPHVHQGGEAHDTLNKREFLNAKDCAVISVGYLIKETGAKYWYDVRREIANFKHEEFSS